MATIELALDDYTDLPPGRIAAVVTHLEMTAPPDVATAPTPPVAPAGIALERLTGADLARYRALFAAVGEPWLWFGRCKLTDAALAALLADEAVEAYAITKDGADVGLLELDARAGCEVELAYFGVIPSAVGTGLGRFMMKRHCGAPGRDTRRASPSTPAPSTIPAPSASTAAPASCPTGARSRSPRTRASSASCRGTPPRRCRCWDDLRRATRAKR